MVLRRWLFLLLAALFLLTGCSLDDSVGSKEKNQKSQYKLFINEYMASNDACCADENGEFDDWIELYNAGADTVNIAGFYLSDDASKITAFQIPATNPAKTKIPPKGFLLLWADGQPDQGVRHLDFKLSSGGEDIVLTEPNGLVVVDKRTFGPQKTDVSEGRYPDGGNEWRTFTSTTPGASNSGQASEAHPPEISGIAVSPDTIRAGDVVTVSADVTDPDGDLQSVELVYGQKDSLSHTAHMAANGKMYQAQIGPFNDGMRIFFLVKAADAKGQKAVSDTLSFEVGFVAPTLFINEFLASNDACCADEHGEYDDWIEIYNPGATAVNLAGFYITDDLSDLTKWQIPSVSPDSTTIPAGGFLVLWADKQPEQGVLHVNIKLSGKGEQIGLTAPNGTTVIDSLTFGAQTADVSTGRLPDGSSHWQTFTTPTPGASNH